MGASGPGHSLGPLPQPQKLMAFQPAPKVIRCTTNTPEEGGQLGPNSSVLLGGQSDNEYDSTKSCHL